MSCTVVVVEDDDDIRLSMRLALEIAGHRVADVASGEDALAWLASNHADVMLLDVRLPEMSGWDVLERLPDSSQEPLPDVILVSALASRSLRTRAEALGCFAVVAKPFLPDEILALLEARSR